MSDELRALHVRMDLEGDLCQGCANEAMDFYAPWPCAVIDTLDALAEAETRIEHLQKRVEVLVMVTGSEIDWKTRIGVVRALHPPKTDAVGGVWCGGCSDEFGDSCPWPCPTIRAVDGEQSAQVWQDAEDLRVGREMISRLGDDPAEFEDTDVREMGRVAREVIRG